MKTSVLFAWLMALAGVAVAISGCNSATGATPQAISSPPLPTATPAATKLYVDHNGTFYEYRLPLTANSKPVLTLNEWPGLSTAPKIAVAPYGNIALASTEELRIFQPPIVSFARSRAKLRLKLTPAMTGIGQFGADLVDIDYDPNSNLWLLNDLGPEITELRTPISRSSVAAVTIIWGAPGSKTAGFTQLVQGRFDVNAALYVYALSSTRGRIFKVGFPYAKPPGSLGINLAQADFVDTSQWPPTAPNAPSLLLGQYIGILSSPHPGSPPSPPVDVMGQFAQPLNFNQHGLFPDAHANAVVGALVADPYRASFYTLDQGDGRLDVWGLPLTNKANAKLSLPCLGGASNCGNKLEHLFLAP
ncbi:MAG: hypothetical protein JO104_02410 [Candidatus Eremiobacteraeota bacterium]|nr:hypothetical protein [Candidatus Eremiobacteraeota bacterium]